MQCPFPGMDPYIERRAIFPDFHDHLVTVIKAVLQPLLRPRYAALMQDRLYVVEAEQSRKPDVSIVAARGATAGSGTATAVLEATAIEVDTPVVFEDFREEMREPYIEIIEPAAGNRLVTAIEVLSPDNKQSGVGRAAYLAKRDQFEAAGANIIEIDLLRDGEPTVRLREVELQRLPPWHYLVAVSRWHAARREVYPVTLQQRLPRIAVPLAAGDRDVPLDLQAVFTRCWSEGAYPELLRYHQPAPGTMSDDERRWCRERLRAAGFDAP